MSGAKEETIREKIQFFRKAAFWPLSANLDAGGWLTNFRPDEQQYALALLDSFLYYSSDLTSKILASEFHRISALLCPMESSLTERLAKWRDFRQHVLVTYPTDEQPGATDSGRMYLRKARGVLGLKQTQFVDPQDAVARLVSTPDTPVVLVDDFAGTGNQIIETWNRQYNINGEAISLADLGEACIVYIPMLCTEKAYRRISVSAPSLRLRPGHILSDDYSVLHPNSIMWPEELRSTGMDVVRRASERAGVPMGSGTKPGDWCGFASLGLGVALDDTIPDASLTIFYWEENGWRPLKRRP